MFNINTRPSEPKAIKHKHKKMAGDGKGLPVKVFVIKKRVYCCHEYSQTLFAR